MFARIRNFLAPPVFEDDEKTRVAALLNNILLAFFVIASVFTVVASLSVSSTTVASLLIGSGTSVLSLVLWFAMRRGHVRLASILFSVIVLASITTALSFSGNIQSSMSAGYIICIVAAGILMGSRAALAFTAASLLALLGLFQADAAGLLPPGRESNSLVGYLAVFSVTAVLISLASRSIATALARTRRSERDLAERNRELAERTQALTERAQELRLTAELSQRIATMRDLDPLLAQSAKLIQESFDLYYVQIYLADSAGRNLALRAGTGEAGAALVSRGHALPIGPGSINGAAASTKKAVIVPDTAQSATFLPNPLLPDTRSEMAVPLVVGEQAVGVLNLQDDQPGSLTDTVLPVFETLAGQLATAIDNANLFAEATQARAQVETQLKWLAHEGWQDFLDGIRRSERIGYAYEGDTLEPVTESLEAAPAPHVLAAPIQVQQAPVGAIRIAGEDGRTWTEADAELVASTAHQVAQQVENLRLLAQADQYRAEAEQATRRLTQEGWQEYLAAKAESSTGFVYDRYEVKPLTGETVPTVEAGEPALTRPLKVQGESIGQLAINGIEALEDESIRLLDTVAERLGAHIENLRLFEETRTREHELEVRGRELSASQRVTFAAAETTDPDKLLDLVVNLIRDQFDLYHTQVYLVDEEKQAAVLYKSTGYAGQQLLEQEHQIPLSQPSLITKAIHENEPVVRNDVSKDTDWMSNPLLPHTKSELVLPLKTGDRMMGVLDVQSRSYDFFTPSIVSLFQTMAEQVAMNFQTGDLLERTTEQAESLTRFATQLRTAAEMVERLNTILDPGQLLNEVADLLQSRFGIYHAHVYLLEEPQQELLAQASPDEVARIMRERKLLMRAGSGEVGKVLLERGHSVLLNSEHSLVARAARNREIVQVDDTSLESDYLPNPLLPETRSEVSVPLIAGDDVLGVLDVQDNQPRRFTQSDVDVLSTLAGQIATALQNASYFEEVQRTAERLREVDRLKSEFLASMSHELRTPLNSIIGYTEIMLMGIDTDLDSETLEDIQAIYDNGQHLLRIINDVLDLAKIEAGRLELNKEEVPVEVLVDAASTSVTGLLINKEKPVEFKVEIEENLPMILGDQVRLNQVINNLASNAVKFTDEGHITLRAFRDNDWICLEVEDTGIGIAKEDLDKIFERFQQVDGSNARRQEGTGLGLAITRHLVQMHGGMIKVKSEPGAGATFTVRLPFESNGEKDATSDVVDMLLE